MQVQILDYQTTSQEESYCDLAEVKRFSMDKMYTSTLQLT